MSCAHLWQTTPKLAVIEQRPDDFLGFIVPSMPKMIDCQYCKWCGALRLTSSGLAQVVDAVARTDPTVTG